MATENFIDYLLNKYGLFATLGIFVIGCGIIALLFNLLTIPFSRKSKRTEPVDQPEYPDAA